MNNKIITMTGFRRHDYTKIVIDNLKKCIGFEDYLLLPTIEPGYPAVSKIFDNLPNCEVVVNDQVLGCSTNTLKALQRGFDTSDFVIHIEDDTVPGIDSLKFFEWIDKTYKDDKEIFTGTAYNRIENIDSRNYFTVAKYPWFFPWMWCTWIDRFEEMKREWDFQTWGVNLNAKIRKNRCVVRPHLARSQNIGKNLGVHTTPDFWRNNHYNPTWVNSVKDISFENLTYTESIIDEIKNFVTEEYRTILKREPDLEGLEVHMNLITSGRLTKKELSNVLRESEEYKNGI